MALEQDQRISDVVTRERSRLRAFIRRRVPDSADAEDILHRKGPILNPVLERLPLEAFHDDFAGTMAVGEPRGLVELRGVTVAP